MISDTQQAVNQASSSLRQFAQKTQGEKGQMNKNDFLNLFMTQVSNQDPLSPMDSAAMMSQISQMGSMEQLQNLNAKMDTVISQGNDSIKLGSQSFLGAEVSYTDNMIRVADGKPSSISYRLPEDASAVIASVIDGEGNTTKQIPIGQQKNGLHRFTWDGKTENDEVTKDGTYSVEFMAVNANGKRINVDTNRTKRIDGVSYKNNAPVFHLGQKQMSLEEIQMFDKKSAGRFAGAVPFGLKTAKDE